jgi:Protein of unknown function (DUF732)
MFTGITSRAGAVVTAIVVLTGGAILRGDTATADSDADDQFLALLDQEEIPALQNVPSLIDTAHKICRKLDGGMTVDAVVDDMRKNSFTDPSQGQFPARRITSTITRFITAAVQAYCPDDRSRIASIMANPAPGSNESAHRVAAYMLGGGVFVAARHGDYRSDRNANRMPLAPLIGAVPAGETTPDPTQIPAPPPPTAQTRTPPRPIAAPPTPKQSPPPPQQAEPPAIAPQPGGADGSGNTGGNDGGGPAEPSPTPPTPPGLVRLAP